MNKPDVTDVAAPDDVEDDDGMGAYEGIIDPFMHITLHTNEHKTNLQTPTDYRGNTNTFQYVRKELFREFIY